MVGRAELRQALTVGSAVAIVGGLLWFWVEPIVSLGAMARSLVMAVLMLLAWLAWSAAWAWWREQDAEQRELRRRRKRIDRGED